MEKFSGIYKSLLFILLCGGFHNLLIAQTTDVFSTPGTYNWTVPPCVTSITLDVWAGGGGGGVYGLNSHLRVQVRLPMNFVQPLVAEEVVVMCDALTQLLQVRYIQL